MLTKDDLYFCYSSKLSKYLAQRGLRYLFMAKEIRTDAPFSVYEKCKDLSIALSEYKLNK